ncbi:MAG: sulfatase-like hydrolase/transferase, partial [Armatimonadetes bacterium]|nr:sulfatase-like hydrolase/transferase [Armatimonadota bacterium]
LICDCPHLFNSGFQKTFDAAVALRGQEGDMPMLRMNHEIAEIMPREKTRKGYHFQGHTLVDLHCWTNRYARGEADCFPPRTAATAIEFLEENSGFDPFFVWVDFFDPHEPWTAPEYMVRHYDPDYTGTPMMHPNYGRADDYTPAELRNLRARYCAEAELVDRGLGRVLQKIDDLGLWDNSIVVFTSDHGKSLGEHNRTGKTNINDGDDRYWPIYPEVAHIPFMVAAPGLQGGREVDALAQPADILPTLGDLAGVTLEPPEPFHGRSFAPHLQCEDADPVREVAVSATFLRPGQMIGRKATTPVVYTPEWAYVPVGAEGEKELYRLPDDPYAETNVIADSPAVADDLHRRLAAELRALGAPDEAIAGLEL